MTSVKQMDLKEENDKMRAKLADRLSRDKPKSGGGKVEDRLAKMAGIKQTDKENNAEDDDDEEEHESDDHSDGYDSESEEGEGGGSKVTGKMRSDEVAVDIRDKEVKDKEKWKHDKFDANQNDEKKVNKFGKHWNTRRERSKGRSRSRSRRRRSRSSGDRSSRSRSRSRGTKRRRRRRGKFSKSRSRSSSTSESSRSRSGSRRRKSRSSGSRSRTRASSSRPRSRISDRKTGGGDRDSKKSDAVDGENNAEKEGVNLELSGALTADTNTVNGTVVKYSEPTEARKPKKKWRLYVFKVILLA